MPELHETMYGKVFFDAQFPALVKALQQIAEEIKRANDLKEKFGR